MITKKVAIEIANANIKKRLHDSLLNKSIYGALKISKDSISMNKYVCNIEFKNINVEDKINSKGEYYKITIIKADALWTEAKEYTNNISKYYKGQIEGLICYIDKKTGKYSERKASNELDTIKVDKAISIARDNLIEEEQKTLDKELKSIFKKEYVSWYEIEKIFIEEKIINNIKYYKINVLQADVSSIIVGKISKKELRYSDGYVEDIICYINKKTGEYMNEGDIKY